ncbi:MAG: YkgJ family cysteine cluster protein [Candidatus Sericytochromatia bacterium]
MDGPAQDVNPAPGVYACVACGACCAAPDISTLGKPLGAPCRHLGSDMLCGIYADRPAVCRNYRPDWVCAEVAPLPTLEARVAKFLAIYGLALPTQ